MKHSMWHIWRDNFISSLPWRMQTPIGILAYKTQGAAILAKEQYEKDKALYHKEAKGGNMKEVNFEVTEKEEELITKIAGRASRMFKSFDIQYPLLDIMMDITATHANGNKLKLKALLEANDFNFSHDVGGIRSHLDRETGKLMDCFIPRYSRR